jgi:hypothetical protein
MIGSVDTTREASSRGGRWTVSGCQSTQAKTSSQTTFLRTATPKPGRRPNMNHESPGGKSRPGHGFDAGEGSNDRGLASLIAAQRVADVRDDPEERLELLRSSYAPRPGAEAVHIKYRRAAMAFMGWQVQRGVLNPLDDARPGSPWWRAMNERLLRDTCEARLREQGHSGPASSPSVDASVRFAAQPSPLTWYMAHNVTIVSAYLDHRDLAEREDRTERFFINLVLMRLLYAHSMVAAPRLALAWLAPVAPWLGDPRRAMTGIFLSLSRALPDAYAQTAELDTYIARERTIGRLLDLGVIQPRLDQLYQWSAAELQIPELALLVRGGTPAYAWNPDDSGPWAPTPTRLVRTVRRTLPPSDRTSSRPRTTMDSE